MHVTFVVIRMRSALMAIVLLLAVALVSSLTYGLAAGRPGALTGWIIAVDAGHGGDDKGAWFPEHNLVEKDVNLDVARLLSHQLAEEGASVILIRTDDSFVQLGDRAQKANEANARVFISIHVNRYPQDRSCCGAQVFYQKGAQEGQILAKLVQEQLRLIDPTNRRQAVPGDYKVLREAVAPSILVEIGFATNARDRELIMSPRYRRAVAEAIRQGVVAYATQRKAILVPPGAPAARPGAEGNNKRRPVTGTSARLPPR